MDMVAMEDMVMEDPMEVMADTEAMVDMDMEREMLRLSQDMVTLPATLTDPHRVSLLVMVVMAMEVMEDMVTMAREMLSQVMVMLLLLTIHMEDPALSTEAPKV